MKSFDTPAGIKDKLSLIKDYFESNNRDEALFLLMRNYAGYHPYFHEFCLKWLQDRELPDLAHKEKKEK